MLKENSTTNCHDIISTAIYMVGGQQHDSQIKKKITSDIVLCLRVSVSPPI
jgi:hypothetical protein